MGKQEELALAWQEKLSQTGAQGLLEVDEASLGLCTYLHASSAALTVWMGIMGGHLTGLLECRTLVTDIDALK